MEKTPITLKGYKTLEDELKNLKEVERPSVIQAISEAREHGDLSENAEYSAAREKQSFIEGRLLELESLISRAEIINPETLSGDKIIFGATVKIKDEDTEEERVYQIVGEYEADFEAGKIANISPIGRALLGKSEGDSVEVKTPRGLKTYEILEVRFI